MPGGKACAMFSWPISAAGILSLNWDEAQTATIDENQLEKESEAQAEFASLASAASKPENYKMWSRDFADFLYRTARIDRYRSPEFKVASEQGESEYYFRIRVSQLIREKRDRTMEAMRNKYGRRSRSWRTGYAGRSSVSRKKKPMSARQAFKRLSLLEQPCWALSWAAKHFPPALSAERPLPCAPGCGRRKSARISPPPRKPGCSAAAEGRLGG